MRYQTVAGGETWAVWFYFEPGRTVFVAEAFDQDGAAVAMTTSACTEDGTLGTYRYQSSQLTTDPTSGVDLVLVAQDDLGNQDAMHLRIGGYTDFVDDAISDKAEPGDAMDIIAGAISVAQFLPNAINSSVLATNAIGSAELSLAAAQKIANEVLADSTPFNGADIDAAISSRASSSQVSGVDDNVTRLYGGNTRTRLHFPDAAIVSGVAGALRNVPAGNPSHMEAQVKGEAAATWAAPADSYFVVFNYGLAVSGESPRAAAISGTAPTDGTFTVVTPWWPAA